MKRKEYTITDIAESLNVSTASVSRALSGATGVSDGLRAKISEFCDEIGYRPSPYNRNNTERKQKIIALILGDIRNPFYSNLAFIIQKFLREEQYITMVFNSEYEEKNELDFIDMAERFDFSGLMLITAHSQAISHRLSNTALPKVLVNRVLPNYNGSSVLTDNFQAGYEAALHLINLRHRDIGFIGGTQNSSAAIQRFEGYSQAMRNYSLNISEEFLWYSDLKMETGQSISEKFIQLEHRPTAIVCINDMTSLGFINGIKEAGFRVPEDLSVVSFDDIPIASLHDIQLTTVSQHTEAMGKTAVKLMLKQLHSPNAQPERIIMAPQLIVRKTTGLIPN